MMPGPTQLDLFAPPPPKRPAPAPARKRRRTRGVSLGRRPKAARVGFMPHVARPEHDRHDPVHVTMKRVRLAPSFRAEAISRLILAKLAQLKARGVRVIHFSIQHDHLHLMVESDSAKNLSNRMQLLFSQLARAVNRLAGRRGSLFRDRHHRHELTCPTEVRRALVYIFFNERKHSAADGWLDAAALEWLDPHSSVGWFEQWHPDARPPPKQLAAARSFAGKCPVSVPRTWGARRGWQNAGGLLRLHELPRIWR